MMARNDHSGYPIKWFKDQNAARHAYECVICLEVFKDPVQVRDCGHQFCALCIDDILKTDPRCPTCRIEISDVMVFKDHAAGRLIKQLLVNCCNEGCTWQGDLSSLLQSHQNSCKFLINRDENVLESKVDELEQKHDTLMLQVLLLQQKHEQDIKKLKLKHEQDIGDLQLKHRQEKQDINDLRSMREQEKRDIKELQLKLERSDSRLQRLEKKAKESWEEKRTAQVSTEKISSRYPRLDKNRIGSERTEAKKNDNGTESAAPAKQTRLKYERDFLLQFQYKPVCLEKPASLPDIEVVLDTPILPWNQVERSLKREGSNRGPSFRRKRRKRQDFYRQQSGRIRECHPNDWQAYDVQDRSRLPDLFQNLNARRRSFDQ